MGRSGFSFPENSPVLDGSVTFLHTYCFSLRLSSVTYKMGVMNLDEGAIAWDSGGPLIKAGCEQPNLSQIPVRKLEQESCFPGQGFSAQLDSFPSLVFLLKCYNSQGFPMPDQSLSRTLSDPV